MSIDATAGLSAAWSSSRTDFAMQALKRAGETADANRLVEASLATMQEANAEPAAAPPREPAPPPPGQGRYVDTMA
ncbi:hypothetical protein [Salinarimonas ramus]|uniref:Uncharacterized protein n=1 Tax=Salinarimonas ramus TaxID=690164 RepID=A0A917Q513_9HYPH|nr:hypothetical protein [Salinarimonas ramus]GGK24969.1 hypothetical protein GCM10011322_09430 [Salinarimonas ramus]